MRKTIKKKILIISFSPIKSDPRVLRQIDSLKQEYLLTVAGYGPISIPGINEISLNYVKRNAYRKIRDSIMMLFGLNRFYYWNLDNNVFNFLRNFNQQKYDIILANNFETVPLALSVAQGSPVFLDSHEYSPEEIAVKFLHLYPLKLYNKWLVKKNIHKIKGMSTVAVGIAEKYSKKYSIELPILVPNTPKYERLEPKKPATGKIKLVYHGRADKQRGITQLIQMMDLIRDDFELNLVLVGNIFEVDRLKKYANDERIFFHEPVETHAISKFLNQFDLGVYSLRPGSLNDHLALPNKFFEFVQARLGVVIGPSPEMSSYVNRFGFGLVAGGFKAEDLAKQLNTLDHEKVWNLKHAAHEAASELCWEKFAPDFLQAIEEAVEH